MFKTWLCNTALKTVIENFKNLRTMAVSLVSYEPISQRHFVFCHMNFLFLRSDNNAYRVNSEQ